MKSADRYTIPTDDAPSPREFGLILTHSGIANRHSKQKTTLLSTFVNVAIKKHLNSEYSNCYFTTNSISKMILDLEVIIFLNFLSWRKKSFFRSKDKELRPFRLCTSFWSSMKDVWNDWLPFLLWLGIVCAFLSFTTLLGDQCIFADLSVLI